MMIENINIALSAKEAASNQLGDYAGGSFLRAKQSILKKVVKNKIKA